MPAHTHDGIDWVARLADLRQADAANAPALRAVADRLIESLPAPRPTVMDVGCGAGGMSAALAAALAGRAARAAGPTTGTLETAANTRTDTPNAHLDLNAATPAAATPADDAPAGDQPADPADPAGSSAGDSAGSSASDSAGSSVLGGSPVGATIGGSPIGRSSADGSSAEDLVLGGLPGGTVIGGSSAGGELGAGSSAGDPLLGTAERSAVGPRTANLPSGGSSGDSSAGDAPSSHGGRSVGSSASGLSVAARSVSGRPASGDLPAGGTLVLVDMVPELLAAAEAVVAGAAGVDGAVRLLTMLADIADPAQFEGLPDADLVWASNVTHHVPDQREAIATLVRRLAPGGCLALSEGGLSMRCLPWDVGVGEPGLQDRLVAAQGTWFHRMRTEMPGAVR